MEPVRPFLSLYNPINLAYRDKMLEQDYISYHQQNSIKHIRIAMPIAIILYTAFAWLDYILFPEIAVSFIKIRLFIVAPFLILVIINTFIDTKGKYLQLLTSLSVLVGGFGVLGMLCIGG